MYGAEKEWGCKWFELWRQHVEEAVRKKQKLRVFFTEGRVGEGKIDSWAACRDDASRRDMLFKDRQQFLRDLPETENQRLEELSSELRDDSKGEMPGSAREDEEKRLFAASRSNADRQFLQGHRGLGNSQKAEVAWLEKMGYDYEECDVRMEAMRLLYGGCSIEQLRRM
jgi:hypothetical protein